jgi:DNA-binding winged helix-turn-helix (wHTH) protein
MRFAFGDCVLDSDSREVSRSGKAISLPPKSLCLLELLIRERPRALSKEEIHSRIWGNTCVSDASLANLVSRLRSALGDTARQSAQIRTVSRFGYSFVGSVQESCPAAPEETRRTAHRLLRGDRDLLLSFGENLIGRGEDCSVWVDDLAVSRHHARIVIDQEGARIEDLESRNGTFVMGVRIATPSALADGDLIRIGEASMIFRTFDHSISTAVVGRSALRDGR